MLYVVRSEQLDKMPGAMCKVTDTLAGNIFSILNGTPWNTVKYLELWLQKNDDLCMVADEAIHLL